MTIGYVRYKFLVKHLHYNSPQIGARNYCFHKITQIPPTTALKYLLKFSTVVYGRCRDLRVRSTFVFIITPNPIIYERPPSAIYSP